MSEQILTIRPMLLLLTPPEPKCAISGPNDQAREQPNKTNTCKF